MSWVCMLGGAVGGYWKGAYKSMESRQLHSGFATDSRRIRGYSRRIRIEIRMDSHQIREDSRKSPQTIRVDSRGFALVSRGVTCVRGL